MSLEELKQRAERQLKMCPHTQIHFYNEMPNPNCHLCLQEELSRSEELNRELAKQLEDQLYITKHSCEGFCPKCSILARVREMGK